MKQNQELIDLARLFTKNPNGLIDNLNQFYSKYTNFDKIIKLLVIWLIQYHYFCKTYRTYNNFINIIVSKQSVLINAEKLTEHSYDLPKLDKNYFYSFLSYIFASFFSHLTLRGFGYEKNKLFSKYFSFISRFLLRHLPTTSNLNKKNELIDILSNYLNKIDMKYLDLSLPDIFFSNQIKLLSKNKKIIQTSPFVFWDFDGYENILLVNSKLHVNGYQHGGGYTLKKDLMDIFEKLISDHFWSWGFEDLSIIQHRYSKSKGFKSNKINRILWVERSNNIEIYKFLKPDFFFELDDKRAINFIEDELRDIKIKKYRIPYFERKSKLYDESKIKSFPRGKKPEEIIDNNDLIIFDHICHTLIYFCLCRNINFICLIDLRKYSSKYDENFINFLKSKDVLFDCSKKFLKNHIEKLNYNLNK